MMVLYVVESEQWLPSIELWSLSVGRLIQIIPHSNHAGTHDQSSISSAPMISK